MNDWIARGIGHGTCRPIEGLPGASGSDPLRGDARARARRTGRHAWRHLAYAAKHPTAGMGRILSLSTPRALGDIMHDLKRLFRVPSGNPGTRGATTRPAGRAAACWATGQPAATQYGRPS